MCTMSDKDKETAHKIYTQQFEHSTIADQSSDLPIFDYNELTLGPVLGTGGFGVVSEIRAFEVSSTFLNVNHRDSTPEELTAVEDPHSTRTSVHTLNNDEIQGRQFISDHCIRDGTDARYAIKMLKPELTGHTLIKGLADMAVETHILSAIEHPNIVKLRATSAQERYDPYYFIVMDRLYDTLETRIDTWAKTMKELLPPPLPSPKAPKQPPQSTAAKGGSGFFGLCGGKADGHVVVAPPADEPEPLPVETPAEVKKRTEGLNQLLEARLVAMFDLAAAIQYLHDRNLIYRDIKPENAAFDVRGDIKLFDFGTSKELPPQNLKRDLTFQLTGVTGSLPYMAPEVAKTEPYNHKCDTFSFAVLMWRVMKLEMPFAEYEHDLHLFFDEVHCGPHKRPNIPSNWPLPIQLCVKRGWCQEPKERMELEQIVKVLKKEIVRVRKGDATGLQHNRRRSTFVWRRR